MGFKGYFSPSNLSRALPDGPPPPAIATVMSFQQLLLVSITAMGVRDTLISPTLRHIVPALASTSVLQPPLPQK